MINKYIVVCPNCGTKLITVCSNAASDTYCPQCYRQLPSELYTKERNNTMTLTIYPKRRKLRRCEQPTHKPIASTTNLRLHSILQMQKRNISAAKIAAPRLRESTCEEIFALFAMPICAQKQRSTALLLLKQRQIRVRILLRQN